MTWSTSAVAVCLSRASASSSKSLTFSIAITAWSAKVVASSICLSENGLGSVLHNWMTPTRASSRSRGHRQQRTISAESLGVAPAVISVSQYIGNVKRAPLSRRTPDDRAVPRRCRVLLPKGPELGGRPVVSGHAKEFAVEPVDERLVGAAQLRRGFNERGEHGGKVESGAANDLQDLGGSGLLLQ